MNRASMLWLIVAGVLFVAGSLFAGDTEVGGEVFTNWNLALNNQSIAVAKDVKNYNNFDISRAWINVKHTFNDKYWARVTMDLSGPDADIAARVQFAYLHINDVLPNTGVRFGLQESIWTDMVDKAWGLRYVDNASMEQFGFADFADYGVSFYSTLPDNWGHAVLQIMNGGGFENAEANKYKDFTFFAEITPMASNPDWAQTALYGMYYYGFPNIMPTGGGFSDVTKKQRFALAGKLVYKHWFTLYVDYFQTDDDTSIVGQPAGSYFPEEDKSKGATVFGRVKAAGPETAFLSHVFAFGKLQFLNRHTNYSDVHVSLYADEGDAKHLMAGAGYELADGVEMAFTFRRTTEDRIQFDADEEPLRIAETERNSVMLNFLASF